MAQTVTDTLAKAAEPTALDLHASTLEELQLARVYRRRLTQVCLVDGYNSDDNQSDEDEEEGRLHTQRSGEDEEEGRLHTQRLYHDNGNRKYLKTYHMLAARGDLPTAERLVEEKHYDVDGNCRVDIHFGLGQPYLSRKHFHWNLRLKSEQSFFVEDERTMHARKAGQWREYYENGGLKSEVQYDANGMRCGFCKRYSHDGTVEWMKDYTKDHIERLADLNKSRSPGKDGAAVEEAAKLLGFEPEKMPRSKAEVDRVYRKRCKPLHPDKSASPDANEKFAAVNRAREVLLYFFSMA